MTSRHADRPPGIAARWDGICPTCYGPIIRGESRVYAHRGEWIHCECASGASDE
jgi:hypothetical protein